MPTAAQAMPSPAPPPAAPAARPDTLHPSPTSTPPPARPAPEPPVPEPLAPGVEDGDIECAQMYNLEIISLIQQQYEPLPSLHDEMKHAGIPAEHCEEAEQS
jgi:hypothetical protein